MRWQKIFFLLNHLAADGYLAPKRNEFFRRLMERIVADPAAGDEALADQLEKQGKPPALDLPKIAAALRKEMGILTEEDHRVQLARDIAAAAAEKRVRGG